MIIAINSAKISACSSEAYEECKLDRHATISLLKEINSELESELGESIPESSIISYPASKTKADTPKNKYEEIMQKCLIRYADYIMTKLKEWGINTNNILKRS